MPNILGLAALASIRVKPQKSSKVFLVQSAEMSVFCHNPRAKGQSTSPPERNQMVHWMGHRFIGNTLNTGPCQRQPLNLDSVFFVPLLLTCLWLHHHLCPFALLPGSRHTNRESITHSFLSLVQLSAFNLSNQFGTLPTPRSACRYTLSPSIYRVPLPPTPH